MNAPSRHWSMGGGLGLAALLLVVLVGWFLHTHERVEEQVAVGPRGWAVINPYLAMERYLQEMGVPCETWFHLQELPDEGVIFVLTRDPLDRRRLADPLVRWTMDGGQLWVVAVEDEEDPFMGRFSATWTETGARDLYLPVSDAGQDRHLLVSVYGELSTQQIPTITIQDRDGRPLAYTNDWGRGQAILLVDDGFLTNDHLGDNDHARWLWSCFGRYRRVVLLARNAPTGWWHLITRHAWMVLISLGVLLLAWLLRVVPRFGPIQPVPEPVRRGLLEHVEAAGAWSWRHGAGGHLLLASRRHCEQRLQRRLPGLSQLQGGDRVRHVAAWAHRPEDLVREALFGQPVTSRDFTRIMRELQELEGKTR